MAETQLLLIHQMQLTSSLLGGCTHGGHYRNRLRVCQPISLCVCLCVLICTGIPLPWQQTAPAGVTSEGNHNRVFVSDLHCILLTALKGGLYYGTVSIMCVCVCVCVLCLCVCVCVCVVRVCVCVCVCGVCLCVCVCVCVYVCVVLHVHIYSSAHALLMCAWTHWSTIAQGPLVCL